MALGGKEAWEPAHAELLRHVVECAGGERARIVVVSYASATPEESAREYAAHFRLLGAGKAQAMIDPADRAAIRDATGIFASGGDQERLMRILHAYGTDEAIRAFVRAGGMYAGASAGAAVISSPMITGGDHVAGVTYGDGLGLVAGVIIDQHLSERRRLARLRTAAKTHGLVGVGVDENTAIVWDGRGEVRVKGAGSVTIIAGDEMHVVRNGWSAAYGSSKKA